MIEADVDVGVFGSHEFRCALAPFFLSEHLNIFKFDRHREGISNRHEILSKMLLCALEFYRIILVTALSIFKT